MPGPGLGAGAAVTYVRGPRGQVEERGLCKQAPGTGETGWDRRGHGALWKLRAGSQSFWGLGTCLGQDLAEQGTFYMGFEGRLGIYHVEKLRVASQRFFQVPDVV